MIARWAGSVVVAGGLAVFGAFTLAGRADEPATKPTPELPSKLDLSRDQEVKRKYPLESLAKRLEYEAKHKAEKDLKLPDAAKKRLDAFEKDTHWQYVANNRTYLLYLAHQKEVKEFVGREGFGKLRMEMSGRALELPSIGSIAFAPAPAAEPNVGPVVVLPGDQPKPTTGVEPVLPSLARLQQFHLHGVFNFANFNGLGLVVDKNRVAGFNAHQFTHMPELNLQVGKEKANEKWNVRRLELVGLLKHDKPLIYVSSNLPRMEELKSAPTRALDPFEQDALKSLRGGEDIVLDSRLNQIRMVGSVRATKTCLKCHDVGRGELLGAFSYLLQRDPPAPVGEK